jgi:hypothetical protein
MFNEKKRELFSVPTATKKEKESKNAVNSFIQAGLKKSAEGLSGNGALKYTTTGDDFLDQFGSLGTFRAIRSYNEISMDMAKLYGQNPLMAVKFTLFMRTITRKTQIVDGDKTEDVQKGGGLRHETIMRMIWLNVNHKEVFWKNINLFISVGSWKDIFDMLRTDLEFNGWDGRVLDWDNFGSLILSGLENPTTSGLVKKYLPSIKAKSKATTVRAQANTLIGKFISSKLFGTKEGGKETYKRYRKLKASGEAHTWQKLISERLFSDIDFGTVHGRALSKLVSSKFLENNKLADKYQSWIESQPVAKFTGYVHELAMNINAPDLGRGYRSNSYPTLRPYQKMTINKQYEGMVKRDKENVDLNQGWIAVRDTSSSMTGEIHGQKISAYDVAKALGIYFGDLLEGPFKNTWIEFASKATLRQYKEDNFVDKWLSDGSDNYGSTNIQSVADLFVKLKVGGVSEEDFPTGILCLSDGELNRVGFYGGDNLKKTNFVTFIDKLRGAGFSKSYVDNFKFVFWDIRNNYYGSDKAKFETFGEHDNVFYMSGYDGSTVGFLLGGEDAEGNVKTAPKTADELFHAAMDQTILNMVTI